MLNFTNTLRLFSLCVALGFTAVARAEDRPNVLWITSEDNSAHWLGCYGNGQVRSPNIDRLSAQGITYDHAYSNAPVCAVARSTILRGVYATTSGTQNMRSSVRVPDQFQPYTSYLRQAGYYTTNHAKTDYNARGNVRGYWDDCGDTAHYKNRPDGKPFFAVFNINTSHESRLFPNVIAGNRRKGIIPETPRVAPADVDLPPFYPDLLEIRQEEVRG